MRVSWTELAVPGLLLSSEACVSDERGSFTKVLSGDDALLRSFLARELYWTSSVRGVLRGLHFQLPPDETDKLVYVVHGSIRDFVVDLRLGSPMERQLFEIELNPRSGALRIPAGCAHAYETLEDDTIVCYAQDVPYGSTSSYAGIRADSAGIVVRVPDPIVTQRDLEYPTLDEFDSPFVYFAP